MRAIFISHQTSTKQSKNHLSLDAAQLPKGTDTATILYNNGQRETKTFVIAK